jgi:hypothetical protein
LVPVLVVETGNFFKRSDRPAEPGDRWVVEAFNEMGVHAVHTAATEIPRLERLRESGRFPAELKTHFVVTAVGSPSNLLVKPYAILNLKALEGSAETRVAVLAIGSPGGAAAFSAATLDVIGRNIAEAARNADLVVALTRGGEQELLTVSRTFPSVDVIVNGTSEGEGREFNRMGNAVAVEAAHSGIALGTLELEWGNDGLVNKWKNQLMPLLPLIADSKDMVNLVARSRRDESDFLRNEAETSPPVTQALAYAGAQACRECHEKAYVAWEKSGHAHAIETLKKEGNEYNRECLRCHVTGFRIDRGFVNLLRTPQLANVQCEACHGRSVDHVNNPQTIHPGVGSLQKFRRRVSRNFCLRCHTKENSPNFKFDVYWPQIAH